MDETVWRPLILSASSDPSPAEAFKPFTLAVSILDIFGGKQVEAWYSGELYLGELV